MNWRAFATGFALALPLTVVGVANAAPQRPALFIEKVTTPAGVVESSPSWGDYLYLGAVNTSRLERPAYEIRCTQAGQVVYGTTYKDLNPPYSVYASPYSELRSTLWSGGAADCTARLVDIYGGGGKFPYRTIATLGFTVAP